MSALNYSKKQIQPLIDKYAINVETNTVFARIIQMYDGQPNYQLWGVKAVFSKIITLEELEQIKAWADEHPQCIKLLQKNGNIISYTSKDDLGRQLFAEMDGLTKITFVKHMISMFNTDQRKILTEVTNVEKLDSLTCSKNRTFIDWHDLFGKFNKLSGNTKKKIIGRMSAVRDATAIRQGLIDGLAEKYNWNRDDLLAYVAANTPKADIVVSDDNVVVLEVKSYDDSKKLCYGRTSWCITSSESQWKSYVGTKTGNKQYFLFDFSKQEKDELAHIGFTVNDKTGFYAAHTTSDSSLMGAGITYHGKQTNIQKALTNAGIPLGLFMNLKPNKNYKWNPDSVTELVAKNKNVLAIALEKDGRMIINVLTNAGLKLLVEHTFVKCEEMQVDSNSKLYVLLDFNLKENDDKAIVAIYFKKDTYKIDTLTRVVDAFNTSIKDDNYIASVNIKTEEFLDREKVDPSILLHKLIDEGDADGACELIDKNPEVDVNFEFNDRRPIFNAIDAKLHKVVGKIISSDKFDCNVDNGLGESLIQDLLFTFYLDATSRLEKANEKPVREMIETIIDSGRFDLNYVDDNDDTVINIAAMNSNMAWLVEKLAAIPTINVNVRNDADCTALGNALRKNNVEAVRILGRRPDLEVTDFDYKLAKKNNIDLKKYLKPQPFAKVDEVEVTKGKTVVSETIDADKYNEIFEKVFSAKK